MAIGFKHGSSVSDVLGITVVPGTTKPSAPKENTIWANSSSTMGSWDISPTEPHLVSKTANLIVYPYRISTDTRYGVTLTVDTSSSNKGKVTVNGTNTYSGNIVFRLSDAGAENKELLLQPGTYYLSGNCPSSSSTTHRLLLGYTYNDWASSTTVSELENDGKFTLTKVAKARVSVQVSGKAKAENAVYQPMLTKDSKGTSYVMGDAFGQVWVKTDATSEILMNTLKKNSIYIQPSAVYEYTADGWTLRDGEVYQYGAWKELIVPWDGYYFRDGNQYEGVTGGWGAWSSGATIGDTIAVTNAGASTNNMVDLTNVNKLWFDSPSGSGALENPGVLCVTSEKNAIEANIKASVQVKAGRGSLDVSGLSGSYYISLYAGSKGYADVSAIWKE